MSVVQLARTPLNLDLSGFLPAQASPTQRLLIDQMREGVGGRLILLAITGDTPEQRAQLSRQLAEQMKRSGQFSLIANGEPLSPAQLDWLMERRYFLSPATTEHTFSTTELRRALEDSLRLLASPLGGVVQTWLPRDPTGTMLTLLQSLGGENPPAVQHGVWFSNDGQRALLLAYSNATGSDARAQEQALTAIRTAFSKVRTSDSTARLQLSGAPVFAAEARQQIERAAQITTAASLLLVTLILGSVYRAWKPVAYSLIPMLSGLLAGAAAVGAWFGSIHGITLAFGAILIGEAVDYPAYLYTHRTSGEPLDATARRIRHALRLAMLTTASGALFMLLSDLEGLRQLGLLAAVGAIAAGMTTRWLLPALDPGDYRLPRLPDWPRPPRWAAIVLLAAAALVLLRTGVAWDDDLARLSPPRPDALQLDQTLRDDLGAPDARFMLTFTAPTAEAALALSERHHRWLERLVRDGIIDGYLLAAQSLPSQTAQSARRAALPDRSTASSNLQSALKGLPFRPETFTPFLQDIERARSLPLIQRGDLEGSPWATRVDALLTQANGQWIALAPLSGVSHPAQLRSALDRLGAPGVALLDIKGDTETLLRHAREQALYLMLAGIATMALLLAVSLRSVALAGKTLLPVVAAMLTTAATLLALDVRLNLFHLMSLLLVLGIGLNYALFFQRYPGNRSPNPRAGLAVGLCGTTSAVAFACLAVSSVPVLHTIGSTVLLGTLFSLLYATTFRPLNSLQNPG